MKRFALSLILLVAFAAHTLAAVFTTTASGNISAGATFVGGSAPAQGGTDQVVVAAGHTLTIDRNTTLGISPCSTSQARPTLSATGSGGSLGAGAYNVRIVAVGGGIEATASSEGSTTITAGQVIRVTLPTLPAGAATWNVYLSNTGGGVEHRYATGKSAGTFDCSSASWEDGTVAFGSAAALPNGDALRCSGTLTVNDGVTLTAYGDVWFTGNLNLGSGSTGGASILLDPSSSPSSGAAVYRLWFGSTETQGTPKLIARGISGNPAVVGTVTSATQGQLSSATQSFNVSVMRLDCQFLDFKRLGGSSYVAVDCKANAAYNQLLTDCRLDASCRAFSISGVPATGGWILTRVKHFGTAGNTFNTREVCFAFGISANVSTGTRTCTDCSFDVLGPALCRGGATWTRCYMGEVYGTMASFGGESQATLQDCFIRKSPYATDTGTLDGFNSSGCFLYIDNVQGNGTGADLNPHGMGVGGWGIGTTTTHDGWTLEYNDDDNSGDLFKSPNGAGTVLIKNCLVVPNHSDLSSGNLMTFPNAPSSDYHGQYEHNTCYGDAYPAITTSEGGAQPAGTITSVKSNLVINKAASGTGRYLIGKSDGNGAGDTNDVVLAANCCNNAGWNMLANGNAATWYNIKCTGTPGTNDVDLGDSAGADMAINGPKFVDPTRKFIGWAVSELGASGTDAQKIAAGLNALKAVADTTDANHVNGLLMTDPATWVRAGFAPTNVSLKDAGHDGVTIGAVEGVFAANKTFPYYYIAH